jgi:uncharacterized protein involved in outer membrane biogenesis
MVLWAIALLLALWAVAWVGVPALKGVAERKLGEAIGRPLQIGALEFAPWSLALTLRDLRIAGADAAAAPLLQVERLHADFELASLRHRAPVLAALDVDAPRLRLTRLPDGSTDVDDLRRRFAPSPAASGPAASEPARLALYNLKLQRGEVQLDDRAVGRRHELTALTVELPFVSNLPVHVDVKVEPRLAFQLNGARFDSGAQAAPFATRRDASVHMQVADLDLQPWLPYLPAGLPLQAQRARLDADLALRFSLAADDTPRLRLDGQLAARDVALADAAGAPLAGWQQLQVQVGDSEPLARRVVLDSVRLEGATLHLRRDAQGRLVALPPPASAPGTRSQPAAPWSVRVARGELVDATVRWHDDTTSPAATARLEGVHATLTGLVLPFEQPAAFDASAQLLPPDGAAGDAGRATLRVAGQASARAARAQFALDGLPLPWFAPYVAQRLLPRVGGRLAAQGHVDWAGGDAPRLVLAVEQAQLDGLRLDEPGRGALPAASSQAIALRDLVVDLPAQRVQVASIDWQQPQLQLRRAADGDWNVLGWPRPAAASAPTTNDWRVAVGDFKLSSGRLRLDDAATPAPVRAQLSALDVSLQGLAWPSAGRPPARGRVALRLAGVERGAVPAALEWSGQLQAQPALLRGKLQVKRWPVHLFEPYFGATPPTVALLRGEASWQGEVDLQQRPGGWAANARGNALLGDVRVHARSADGVIGDELLTWNSLALDGLQADLAPGATPRVVLGEAVLTDFYSRLVITEQGRFNLQDVAGATPAAPAASAPAAAPASAPAGLPLELSVGATRLVQGRVDFTDRFVRPNYSAALSELNGRLGAFRSGSREMAAIEVRGRAAGTALLEVIGSLNPSAEPLALDIRAKATDLELAPLSPYSGRYAGYAIERGKLSMDVHYKIEPDGKLDAKNQIVLNQLTFGDKVDSPDATKLPVLLAVALLKDRHGVIDIDLPVSGSINDPQFSVFGLVLKIIGNLLVKALTAPFSLLAGGGSEDLSVVAFAPGTATLTDAGRAAIDKVAKALAERPALQMTVTGTSDPASERDAARRAALEARLVAEQRRERARTGAPADAPLPPLAGDERARIVKRVYDDTKLPDKPRNVLGFAKTIPVAEMEQRLADALPADAQTARELALQRGLAVRDALVAKGLASERLFLAAPRLRSDEDKDWSPRAQLSLALR